MIIVKTMNILSVKPILPPPLSHPSQVHSSANLSQWTPRGFLFRIHSPVAGSLLFHLPPLPHLLHSYLSEHVTQLGFVGISLPAFVFPGSLRTPPHCMLSSIPPSLPPFLTCFLISLLLCKPLGVGDRIHLL